jgi:hypothetical protein
VVGGVEEEKNLSVVLELSLHKGRPKKRHGDYVSDGESP